MFQTKCVDRKHILSSVTVSENRVVREIKWKNIVEPDWPQMTMWHMRSACWILKAINTPSEYVIFIAFGRQQWLRERASIAFIRTLPVLLI